jgi:hypothetical protein
MNGPPEPCPNCPSGFNRVIGRCGPVGLGGPAEPHKCRFLPVVSQVGP